MTLSTGWHTDNDAPEIRSPCDRVCTSYESLAKLGDCF